MADTTYTVFVRVPIPRGDFVDPPQVHWDSSKDDALWKILSGAAQTEIDWNQVARTFDVPVDFLLQQVAYLTERHASQVRAQVRKATAAAKGSSASSPIPGAEPGGQGNNRTASVLSGRRTSPMSRNDGAGSLTPLNTSTRPIVSRNTSGNTAVLAGASSPRLGKAPALRPAEQSGRKRLSSLPISSPVSKPAEPPIEPDQDRASTPGPAESVSTTSSDDESSPAQSRIIRRPPRFQQQEPAPSYDEHDDEDDESEPAFQQYKGPPNEIPSQDLASTLKGDGQGTPKRSQKSFGKGRIHHSQTSDSSGGSGAIVQRPGKSREGKSAGPLSPHRTAERAGRSPSGKGKGQSQDGSDGTPSMGSSFSDLEDASVTQSALEEVLASHMDRGAGSRFSISQAFRSRYTPSSKQ